MTGKTGRRLRSQMLVSSPTPMKTETMVAVAATEDADAPVLSPDARVRSRVATGTTAPAELCAQYAMGASRKARGTNLSLVLQPP